MTTYHSNGTQDPESDQPLGEKVREHVETGLDAAREAASAAGEATSAAAREAAANARENVGNAVERTANDGTRFVRENPAIALAGAVSVGVLIGLALNRRS